jgi:hypothetical protein
MSTNQNKSNIPLPLFWKIMVFLLPITVLSGAVFIIPHHIYQRSREEAWAWAIWGAVTWAIIILIVIGLRMVYTQN